MSAENYSPLEAGREEESLFFSTTPQEQACVGHLRGDFGGGAEFWTTWWEHQDNLKTQDFKDELDELVKALRKDGPLKDLRSMERFCREHPQARMSPESGSDYYGFRVDTAQRRYCLRFLPRRGDYNFYIYCYQTDKLERSGPQTPREEPVNKKIKVLVVEPMKPCEVREIPDSLEAMQGIVGGLIEFSAPFSDSAVIICNEEGKNLDLPYNRPLCGLDGIPYDILCGTFFVAGVEREELVSLTDGQIERYKDLYDNMIILTAEKEPPQEKKAPKGQKKKRHNER